MTRIKIYILGMVVFFSYSTLLWADCDISYPFGSVLYHYVESIPDGIDRSSISTIFYAYNTDTSGVFSHNGTYSSDNWFQNQSGVWFAMGNWLNDNTTACPPLDYGDETVQIVAWDTDLTTADAPMKFAVFGAPWNSGATNSFDFDEITDGDPSLFGGPNNCAIPMQDIPKPTVGSLVFPFPPIDVNLSWTEPTYYSYGVGSGHTEYFWGYRIYYTITEPQGTVPTANSGWTPVPGSDGYVPRGAGGTSFVLNINFPVYSSIWFALAIVGQGNDNGSPVNTQFETGFVGPPDHLEYCTDPYSPHGSMALYAVPNGAALTIPLTALKLTSSGDQIEIQYDSTTCPTDDHILVYGRLNDLASCDEIEGYECPMFLPNPYTWTGVPQDYDLWFLLSGLVYCAHPLDIMLTGRWNHCVSLPYDPQPYCGEFVTDSAGANCP